MSIISKHAHFVINNYVGLADKSICFPEIRKSEKD